jgi:HlyD family secretion protein
VLADGTLAERTVTTGLANWRYTEVATGVTAGDRVVSSLDQQGLGPGLRVAVRGQPQGNGP